MIVCCRSGMHGHGTVAIDTDRHANPQPRLSHPRANHTTSSTTMTAATIHIQAFEPA